MVEEKNEDNQFQDIIDGGNIGGFGEEGDEEVFEIVNSGAGNADDDYFDEVVGCLQEVLLDPEFEKMQKDFSTKHCMTFEATEENKLVYMDIFQKYNATIEGHITEQLTEMVAEFSMERFISLLKDRKDQIDEPLMDLLLSFSEFEQFKEMMLFARAHFVATTPKIRSGKAAALGLKDSLGNSAAGSSSSGSKGLVGSAQAGSSKMQSGDMKHFESCIDGLQVAGRSTRIHKDESLDGDERPDLNNLVIGNK